MSLCLSPHGSSRSLSERDVFLIGNYSGRALNAATLYTRPCFPTIMSTFSRRHKVLTTSGASMVTWWVRRIRKHIPPPTSGPNTQPLRLTSSVSMVTALSNAAHICLWEDLSVVSSLPVPCDLQCKKVLHWGRHFVCPREAHMNLSRPLVIRPDRDTSLHSRISSQHDLSSVGL